MKCSVATSLARRVTGLMYRGRRASHEGMGLVQPGGWARAIALVLDRGAKSDLVLAQVLKHFVGHEDRLVPIN
jgi:hypothetical protein